MATIAQDLARARKLTETAPEIGEDGIPPLEIVAERRNRGQPYAALYGRHSSPGQKSTPAQIELCRQRCQERGWKPKYILTDEGKSATDPSREAFARLIDIIGNEQIDVLVVWKIDRIVRNLAQAAVLNEYATEHGVALHSITEPIDTTTPLGRFVFGIIAAAAEMELSIKKERVTMGIAYRAGEGRWPRPHVPFGLRRVKSNFLAPYEPNATSIRECFHQYIKTPSYSETAHRLDERGLRHGKLRWTERRVRSVLENPIYAGKIEIGVVKAYRAQTAVISCELYDKVAKLRQLRVKSGEPASQGLREKALERVFQQYIDSLDDLPD
jgi:site-specific DNA recombinase